MGIDPPKKRNHRFSEIYHNHDVAKPTDQPIQHVLCIHNLHLNIHIKNTTLSDFVPSSFGAHGLQVESAAAVTREIV